MPELNEVMAAILGKERGKCRIYIRLFRDQIAGGQRLRVENNTGYCLDLESLLVTDPALAY